MKVQVSGGKCRVCSGVGESSLPPTNCNTKPFNIHDMKLGAVTLEQQWTTVFTINVATSHPLFFLQVFSEYTSVCALTEEDSRAELNDILWGSVNVEGGWAQRERGRGRWGWREGDSGSRCCEDSGIVGDLFCCSVFLFPSPFPHLLQVQKRKESWHSAPVWGSQANDKM